MRAELSKLVNPLQLYGIQVSPPDLRLQSWSHNSVQNTLAKGVTQ